MATIKGVTLKGITKFKGHEGESCRQGNIYLDGKKVGYFSDSYYMGPPDIDFDSKELEQEVQSRCKGFYAEHPEERWYADSEPDLEEFFEKVFDLTNSEKYYKKACKMGYSVVLIYEENNCQDSHVIYCKTIEIANKCIKENAKITKHKIFTSNDDFNIK